MAFGSRFHPIAALVCAGSLLVSACGEDAAPARPAVTADRTAEAATVNGQIIYVADVEMEAQMRGLIAVGESLEPTSQEFDEVLDQLIEIKLLSMEAVARGLDEEAEARHRLETARDNILGNVLLEHIASERIDEAAVRRMYDTQVALLEQQMENEARLRHIQAASKADIDKIAAELKAGADFAVTAARRSNDEGTRMDGGDLGYMTAEDASPEFARVIREVPQGGVSRPFEDSQGWHIVKVDEVRKKRPPSIEELRGRIERYLKAQQLDEILKELRGQADIVKRNPSRGAKPEAPERPAARPAADPAPVAETVAAEAAPVAGSGAAAPVRPAATPSAVAPASPAASAPTAPAATAPASGPAPVGTASESREPAAGARPATPPSAPRPSTPQ